MTAHPVPVAVPELALLERALAYTRWTLTSAAGADPALPTPCTEWDLTDLLLHLHESMSALEEAGRVGRVAVDLPAPARLSPALAASRTLAPVMRAVRHRADRLLTAWTLHAGDRLVSVAGSPLRAGVLAAAGALEIAVHGWDVAAAARPPGAPPPDLPAGLATDLTAYLPLLVQPADRATRFAWAVPLAPGSPGTADATAGTVLLAATGRDPAWVGWR